MKLYSVMLQGLKVAGFSVCRRRTHKVIVELLCSVLYRRKTTQPGTVSVLRSQINLQFKFVKSQAAHENVECSVEIFWVCDINRKSKKEECLVITCISTLSDIYQKKSNILNFISSISGSSLLRGKSMKLQTSEDHQGQRNWIYRSSTGIVHHVPPVDPGIKPAD